jgi:hypothetical protein
MRLILVTLMYGVGALMGVQSVVVAVCFLVWIPRSFPPTT